MYVDTQKTAVAKRRILLVDDDERILRFLRLKLMASGYDVATAMTGHGAQGMIESDAPDALILDLKMPGMDGVELLRRLRKPWKFPIVVVTAASDLAADALSLGADAYVPKPFNLDELVSTVGSLLARG